MQWRGSDFSFPSGDGIGRGYLALPDPAGPDGPGPYPGVVVIHEAYGLDDATHRAAERLADAGYAALAVDLFGSGNRAVCMTRLLAGLQLRPLDNPGIRDLRAALTALAARPEVDPERLGA